MFPTTKKQPAPPTNIGLITKYFNRSATTMQRRTTTVNLEDPQLWSCLRAVLCLMITLLFCLLVVAALLIVAAVRYRGPDYQLGDFTLQYFNLSESYVLNAAWDVTIICKNPAKFDQLAVPPKYNYVAIGYRQRHNILVKSLPITDNIYVPARGFVKINITAGVNGKRIRGETYSRMKREIDGLGGVIFEVLYYGFSQNEDGAISASATGRMYWFEPRLLPLP